MIRSINRFTNTTKFCSIHTVVTYSATHKVKSDTPFLHILTFICINAKRFRYLTGRQLLSLCIQVATKCILLYTHISLCNNVYQALCLLQSVYHLVQHYDSAFCPHYVYAFV